MVAGESGSLCSDCIINSALLLDDSSRDNDKEERFFLRLLIASLDRSCEAEHRDVNLKNYLLQESIVNSEQRSQILNIANHHSHTSLVIEILGKVPRTNWTLADTISWLYANFNEGRHEEALDHPEVKRENCTDSEYRVFTLNRIANIVELEPPNGEVEKNLADLGSMREIYNSDVYPPPFDETLVLPNVFGTMAKCHYLLGNYDDAFSCLNEKIVSCRPASCRELLRGNIHEKLEDIEGAKQCWNRGLEINEKNVFHSRLTEK